MKNDGKSKCFDVHSSCKVPCDKNECRQWIKSDEYNNCTIIAANNGSMSLEQVGNILGLSRMRICQIEKIARNKFKKRIGNEWSDYETDREQ